MIFFVMAELAISDFVKSKRKLDPKLCWALVIDFFTLGTMPEAL